MVVRDQEAVAWVTQRQQTTERRNIMAGKTRHFTGADLKTHVLDARGVALVDFWAEWCPPCQALGPVIDTVAEQFGEAVVAKVNVDESPEAAQQFGISSIPTVLLFKDGEVVKKFVGVQRAAAFIDAIKAIEVQAT